MKKLFTYLLASLTAITMILTTGCNDPKPDNLPPTVGGTPEITLALKSKTETSAVITATVKATRNIKYINYPKGQRPSGQIEWKDVVVSPADGAFDISITELAMGVEYTIEAMAVNTENSSAAKMLDYRTQTAPPAVDLSQVVGAHNMISFKGVFDKAECDGFFFAIVPADSYKEDKFLTECKPEGEGQVINAVVTKSDLLHKNQNGIIPLPNTAYVIAAVGAKFDDKGFWKSFVGSPRIVEVSTAPVELGKSNTQLGFAVNEETITFGVAEGSISRTSTDGIRGYYYGAVKEADLAGKTLDAYVVEWLMIKNTTAFTQITNIENVNEFGKANSTKVKYKNLSAKTDYVLFALSYDELGWLGKVSSKKITTPEPKINVDDKGIVVAQPLKVGLTNCIVDYTWTAGYSKAYMVFGRANEPSLNDQVALDALYQRHLSGEVADWTSMVKTYDFSSLELNTEYKAHILVVKNDGSYAPMVSLTWKTRELVFDSPAKVAVKVSKIVHDATLDKYIHTIDVTYSEGAVSAEYITAWTDKTNTKTAKELAIKLYENGSTFTPTSSTQLVISYEGSTEIDNSVVFVPIDEAGKRGEPVMFVVARELKN